MTEVQSMVENLKKEVDEANARASSDVEDTNGHDISTTTQFRTIPRSATVQVNSKTTLLVTFVKQPR